MSSGDLRARLLDFVQGLGAKELSADRDTVEGARGELSGALTTSRSPHGEAAVTAASRAEELIDSVRAKLGQAAEILTSYANSL